MKTIVKLVIAILVVSSASLRAQDSYIVTRIKGKVTIEKTGTELKAGDVLQPTDKVKFDTFDSYVISISQNMGRYMIKLHEPPAPETIQLSAYVKDIAIPTKRRSLMTERYRPDETIVSDLRTYFGNDKFTIIGDKVSVPIDPNNYPIDENKFLVFYYRVNNNPVSKKLGYINNNILIEREKLVNTKAGTITQNEIPSVAVYLYERNTRTSEEITKFDLSFVDEETLINEFMTIIPILVKQKMGKDDIKKYLIEYFYDFYGATDSRSIKMFVNDLVDKTVK
jgi:hypothetical protein